MKTRIYTIYDCKTEAYDKPFYSLGDGEAFRMLYRTILKGENNFADYPEDYTLFWIGVYDDETGSIDPASAKISLGTCLDIIVAMKKQQQTRNQILGADNEINNGA